MRQINTFILGAQKCGTTTLSDVLRDHPQIYVPKIKELHFFDLHSSRNLQKEMKHYYKNIMDQHKIIMDATPSYLYIKECRDKIEKELGNDLKFVVILRDPAKRAYSHYLMTKRVGKETEPFDKAIHLENERFKDVRSRKEFSYISRGYYYDQLSYYFETFPRHQFHIMIFEDYIKNPQKEVKGLLNFLGVDDDIELDLSKRSNQKFVYKSPFFRDFLKFIASIFRKIKFRPQLLIRFRRRLNRMNKQYISDSVKTDINFVELNNKYYKDDVIKMSELLDRDLTKIWNFGD